MRKNHNNDEKNGANKATNFWSNLPPKKFHSKGEDHVWTDEDWAMLDDVELLTVLHEMFYSASHLMGCLISMRKEAKIAEADVIIFDSFRGKLSAFLKFAHAVLDNLL